jgi:site-specific DNA recombinase
MRAARYARVSSRAQADNTSIPNQLERIEAYAKAQSWKLVATYVEPGESGENLERPAMTTARQAAQRGEFDVLVIYTLDRLTRDIDDLFLLRREFKALGVRIWAVHDGLDVTTADVDELLGVLFKGYFGHRERTEIVRRMCEGIERHVRAGKFPGGVPPFGYRRDERSYLIIDEPKARIVRMVFEWTVDGNTLSQVCDRLNGMDVPSPSGGTWIPATVHFILRNEIYAGRWTYGRRGSKLPKITIDDIPAIVDRGTWEEARAALTKNRTSTGHPKHRYLLRGLIQCECGGNYCGMAPRREGGPTTYRCLARYDYRRQRPDPCRSLTIRAAELEGAIWADIEEFVQQPHLVAEELSTRRGPVGGELTAKIAEVDKAMKERKAEIDRYLTLYGRGTIPVERLDAKVSEVQGHLAALETYRASLVEEQRRLDLWEREMCGMVETLTALQEKLRAGVTFQDKRALVEMLVKRIKIETVTEDDGERYAKAHVTYRFERPDVSEAPIPIELEPLFAGRKLAESCLTQVPVI